MNRGTIPPGLATPAESWRVLLGGEVAAMMRPIPFDGSQPCNGDDDFTGPDEWPADLADELEEVCAGCPFLTECRDWAIAHERYNYQGGMTPVQRRQYRKRHRIQVVDRHSADLYGLMLWPMTKRATA